jgi:hypothetical protein
MVVVVVVVCVSVHTLGTLLYYDNNNYYCTLDASVRKFLIVGYRVASNSLLVVP